MLNAGAGVESYLVSAGASPIVINSQGIVKTGSQANSVAVKRAVTGQTATTTYLSGARLNIEMLGYYTSIANPAIPTQTLFALVTELPYRLDRPIQSWNIWAGHAYLLGQSA